MNILIKFKPGDTAVRMYLNKVQTIKVETVEVKVKGGEGFGIQTEICYYVSAKDSELTARDNYQYEGSLFATKDELLASL